MSDFNLDLIFVTGIFSCPIHTRCTLPVCLLHSQCVVGDIIMMLLGRRCTETISEMSAVRKSLQYCTTTSLTLPLPPWKAERLQCIFFRVAPAISISLLSHRWSKNLARSYPLKESFTAGSKKGKLAPRKPVVFIERPLIQCTFCGQGRCLSTVTYSQCTMK